MYVSVYLSIYLSIYLSVYVHIYISLSGNGLGGGPVARARVRPRSLRRGLISKDKTAPQGF